MVAIEVKEATMVAVIDGASNNDQGVVDRVGEAVSQ